MSALAPSRLPARPGLLPDRPATARWERGTRVVASHANGAQMATDMPNELGGTGDGVTPGWLFRAGLASCAATSIALVEGGYRSSPIPNAVIGAVPVDLRIDVDAG